MIKTRRNIFPEDSDIEGVGIRRREENDSIIVQGDGYHPFEDLDRWEVGAVITEEIAQFILLGKTISQKDWYPDRMYTVYAERNWLRHAVYRHNSNWYLIKERFSGRQLWTDGQEA